MNTTILCVLIGLPGAGKTTLAKLLRSDCKIFSSMQILHVCFDEIFDESEQKEVVAKTSENSKLFKGLRDRYYEIVKQVLMSIQDSSNECPKYHFLSDIDFSSSHIIILDDNFYYRSMRYKYYQLACQFSTGFCQIYIDCKHSIAEQNNQLRPIQVAESVIATMRGRLETPADSLWEKQSIVLSARNSNSFHSDLPKIIELFKYNFENCLSPPVDKTEEVDLSRLQCLQSFLHQADLMLRNFVTDEMRHHKSQNSNKSYLMDISQRLNKVRLAILDKIKKNEFDIDSVTYNGIVNVEKLKSIFMESNVQ